MPWDIHPITEAEDLAVFQMKGPIEWVGWMNDMHARDLLVASPDPEAGVPTSPDAAQDVANEGNTDAA